MLMLKWMNRLEKAPKNWKLSVMKKTGSLLRLLFSLVVVQCSLYAGTSGKAARPNVLFLAIDDLRPELSCYGATQVKSPHIDKLAQEGLVFKRAYCQVPVCGASRASLMTGILPTPDRFVSYKTRADEDVPGAVTLPQVFKEAGYITISNGKVFHNPQDCNARSWTEPAWRPEVNGLTSYDPETTKKLSEKGRGRIYEHPDVADNAYQDGQTAEKTIADLARLKKSGRPFFLACGLIRPHMPFYAPQRYWDLYQRDDIEIADNRYRPKNAPSALVGSSEYKNYHPGEFSDVHSEAWHRMMRHGYMASVSYSDKLVGDILAALERLGLSDNTIIVLWGDHGWHLGEHSFWGKHNTMHLALRVPLIVKVPGRVSGKVTEALVEDVDIYPTLCSLAGLDVPKSVQGRSFESLLDHPEQDFRDAVYSRFKTGDAVVTKDFAYTRYANQEQMLYDHRSDPEENFNVADETRYRKTVVSMNQLLDEFCRQASRYKPAGTSKE